MPKRPSSSKRSGHSKRKRQTPSAHPMSPLYPLYCDIFKSLRTQIPTKLLQVSKPFYDEEISNIYRKVQLTKDNVAPFFHGVVVQRKYRRKWIDSLGERKLQALSYVNEISFFNIDATVEYVQVMKKLELQISTSTKNNTSLPPTLPSATHLHLQRRFRKELVTALNREQQGHSTSISDKPPVTEFLVTLKRHCRLSKLSLEWLPEPWWNGLGLSHSHGNRLLDHLAHTLKVGSLTIIVGDIADIWEISSSSTTHRPDIQVEIKIERINRDKHDLDNGNYSIIIEKIEDHIRRWTSDLTIDGAQERDFSLSYSIPNTEGLVEVFRRRMEIDERGDPQDLSIEVLGHKVCLFDYDGGLEIENLDFNLEGAWEVEDEDEDEDEAGGELEDDLA